MISDESQRIQQQRRKGKNTEEACSTVRQYRKGARSISEKEKAKRIKDSRIASEWRKENPEAARERDRRYRQKTPAYHAERQRRWRLENYEHSKAYHRAYMARRRNEDVAYRLRRMLASRIVTAMVRRCVVKSAATETLVGCSFRELKDHIESRFLTGMSWENFGRKKGVRCWEIDHRIPCAKFDLSRWDHQSVCFHYSNLQPMWAEDNRKKKDKFPTEEPSTAKKPRLRSKKQQPSATLP